MAAKSRGTDVEVMSDLEASRRQFVSCEDNKRNEPDQIIQYQATAKKDGGSFHTSQFDSKASDYFLLLNQKNHNLVKKRRDIKMKYSDDVLEYEQIFVDMKKDRIEKESELMQKIYEE